MQIYTRVYYSLLHRPSIYSTLRRQLEVDARFGCLTISITETLLCHFAFSYKTLKSLVSYYR